MRQFTKQDEERAMALLETEAPHYWVRVEAKLLGELLATYCALAMESGTEPEKVISYLRQVRHTILNAKKEAGQ